MARYFTVRQPARATLYVEDFHHGKAQDIRPEVCDHESTDTGLLDVNCDPIMREPRSIGFGRRDDW